MVKPEKMTAVQFSENEWGLWVGDRNIADICVHEGDEEIATRFVEFYNKLHSRNADPSKPEPPKTVLEKWG